MNYLNSGKSFKHFPRVYLNLVFPKQTLPEFKMSANNVLLAKNVQVSKLKFSAPKVLNNGSRTVYVNYEGDKLTLQTPLMSLPYGIGDFNEKNAQLNKGKDPVDPNAPKKYDMHVSFRGMDDSPALKSLHDKMVEIERKIRDECFENRLTWLKDDYDGMKNVVDRLFWPIVKLDKDKDTGKVVGRYPPTMKLKLPYDTATDTFQFDCKDMDGNDFDFKKHMKNLKGSRVRLIIQLGGLWFAGGKYGCTWKVVKARIETTSKTNVDFIEDSDDDNTVVKDTHSDEDVEEDALHMADSPPPKNTTQIDDSDEDEPVPPPAPKKGKAPPRREPTPEESEAEEEEPVEEEAEEEEEDVDSEIEDVPPPPPPPKKAPAKKTATKTK